MKKTIMLSVLFLSTNAFASSNCAYTMNLEIYNPVRAYSGEEKYDFYESKILPILRNELENKGFTQVQGNVQNGTTFHVNLDFHIYKGFDINNRDAEFNDYLTSGVITATSSLVDDLLKSQDVTNPNYYRKINSIDIGNNKTRSYQESLNRFLSQIPTCEDLTNRIEQNLPNFIKNLKAELQYDANNKTFIGVSKYGVANLCASARAKAFDQAKAAGFSEDECKEVVPTHEKFIFSNCYEYYYPSKFYALKLKCSHDNN